LSRVRVVVFDRLILELFVETFRLHHQTAVVLFIGSDSPSSA